MSYLPRKTPLGSKVNISKVAPLEPLQAASYSEWSRSVAAFLLRLRNVPLTGERAEVLRLHAPQTVPR